MTYSDPHCRWVAVFTIDFFNEICLLYGSISSLCTPESCPIMSAGEGYTYRWADGDRYREPVSVPAAQYVDLLMSWVDDQISNDSLFPFDDAGDELYPPDFMDAVSTIFRRLFRVYGHLYFSHFRQFVELSAQTHLNTCFKRFLFFILEFDLVPNTHLAPLQRLIDTILEAEEKRDEERVKHIQSQSSASKEH